MNYKEITKMIIAIIFVIGSVASVFVTASAVGEEMVRLITVAILSYYFAGSNLLSRLTSKKK